MDKRIIIPLVLVFIIILVYMSIPSENPDLPDRKLNQIHLRYIENQLNNYGGKEVIITHIVGNEEGKIFAHDIGVYLKATGWETEEKTSWNIFETKQGQYIGLNKDGIMEINVFRKGYYEE